MKQPNNKTASLLLIWSKCIDVQMHFNSLNLTIKGLAITGFTFFIAGIGYLYKEKVYLEEINVLMWFSLMGFLIIALFFFIDRYWYHQYLKATSAHISEIEKNDVLDSDLKTALMVSNRISEESKKPIHGVFVMKSVTKTTLFYFLLAVPFLIISGYASVNHNGVENPRVLQLQSNLETLNSQVINLEVKINSLSKDVSSIYKTKIDTTKMDK